MNTTEHMMELLAARVPVTLLLDIVSPPDAAELFRREGGDAAWLRDAHTSAA